MKKIIYTVALISMLASCDVLDVKPLTQLEGDLAYKDKTGIEKGILGAYASFQDLSYYGRSYLIFSDLAADNLDHPTDATALEYAQVDNNAILPENASVEGMWGSGYSGINTANDVIAHVPDMADMTDDEKNKALAELYFIRALNHFNLMNYFGAIPVKTSPSSDASALNAGRDAVAVVYDQIITDLQFAEAHLGSGSKIRASVYAAKALLARVYLYQGNYTQASAKATDVIENGGYDLINYGDIFTDGSAESIFEIDFTDLKRNRIAEYNFPKSLNGRREVAPNAELLSAYEADDVRFAASVAVAGGLYYPIKYDDLSIGGDNVIVLRLAEMYLIRAEAEASNNGDIDAIQDDIDAIRDRAGLNPTTASTYATLLRAIEKERRVEFAFEGHRWFDLVRTKRAVDVLAKVTNINQTLFPIPLSEIVTNRDSEMKQNPGY